MIIILLLIAFIIFTVWYLEFFAYSIPVLYYHHIEPGDPVTPQVFETQMKYLIFRGYHSVSLDELYGFMKGGLRLHRKSFVLTFDDGFYCNYHYLMPLLKKHNLKATIFVVSGVRKQTSDNPEREVQRGYPSRTGTNKEAMDKFATWDELKVMIETGLASIEDHSLYHDRVYIDDTVKGFNTGAELDWQISGDTRQGTVKYKTGSFLAYKIFTGDIRLNNRLFTLTKEKPFDPYTDEGLNALKTEYIKYKKKNPVKYMYEANDIYINRIKTDLKKSKQTILEHTGRDPGFFCFPWGQYNRKLIKVIKDLGYKGAITTDKGANTKGGDTYRIKRFKVYRSELKWFKTFFFIHRSRLFSTIYSVFYGWL
ncbi:MAG: polysaccharide deacetylase family protein [Deltaproteobacteria bacterium]|nr:polysaccharide deacetylase family protein [Deltaproteobacteria bacterium]MCL5791588.1 polysaccharide deacetylase family protein [Deltaproteobacteria bacterium]